MEPSPENPRYQLELLRNNLKAQQQEHDEKYRSYIFGYISSLEIASFLAYLTIIAVLVSVKKLRTKINAVISVWAFLNALVLAKTLAINLLDYEVNTDILRLSQMVAALARTYGTCLYVAWFYTKFCKPLKNDVLKYILMVFPALVFFFYVGYYFFVTEYIYEAFGPVCDVLNWSTYAWVSFAALCYKASETKTYRSSRMALIVSVLCLLTSLPLSLMTICLRFKLDVSWVYWLHINFVDVAVHVISISCSILVIFALFLSSKDARGCLRKNSKALREGTEEEKRNVFANV